MLPLRTPFSSVLSPHILVEIKPFWICFMTKGFCCCCLFHFVFRINSRLIVTDPLYPPVRIPAAFGTVKFQAGYNSSHFSFPFAAEPQKSEPKLPFSFLHMAQHLSILNLICAMNSSLTARPRSLLNLTSSVCLIQPAFANLMNSATYPTQIQVTSAD